MKISSSRSVKFVWMSLDRPTRSIRLLSICISVNISVILISDWIVSKRFYIKSTDVSTVYMYAHWVTFTEETIVRKNENSFKRRDYVLEHTLQYFEWIYKQAILSDNWGETEFWISSSSSVFRLCSCVAQFQETEKCSALKFSIRSTDIFNFLGDL